MSKEWSSEKYIERAKLEPKRLEFWLKYYNGDIIEASKAVCENSPSIDKYFNNEYKRN